MVRMLNCAIGLVLIALRHRLRGRSKSGRALVRNVCPRLGILWELLWLLLTGNQDQNEVFVVKLTFDSCCVIGPGLILNIELKKVTLTHF